MIKRDFGNLVIYTNKVLKRYGLVKKIDDFRRKYNTIFREDMKKEWNMESFLKLRKDNKNPDCYCTICARRFNMVC